MKGKKHAPKKRAYNRKPKLVEPLAKPEEKDNELELLALMCSVVDNWDDSQKKRNLQFLFSKYDKYIN